VPFSALRLLRCRCPAGRTERPHQPQTLARAQGIVPELLVPGGVLLMEHADVQGEELVRRLTATGNWTEVTDHADLTGLPRVTRAVRGGR